MNSNITESNLEQRLPALSDFFYKSDCFNYYSLSNSENKLEIRFPEFVDEKRKLANNQASFYKIETLSFDDEYPRREAFENVLYAVDEPTRNFVYILEGNQDGIRMYIGVVNNSDDNTGKLTTRDYRENLKAAFEGNFNGSKLTAVMDTKKSGSNFNEYQHLIDVDYRTYKRAGFIVGVPSINKDSENSDSGDFQGIDRLINAMLGKNWRIAIICEPISDESIYEYQTRVYEIYNKLSVYSNLSLQHQTSENQGQSDNTTVVNNKSHTDGVNSGVTTTEGISDTTNNSSGNSSSGHSTNSGKTENNGTSVSDSYGSSTSLSRGTNIGRGSSTSLSFEVVNKRIKETLAYIDDELLKRLKIGKSKGLYKTSLIYMTENKQDNICLKNTLMSLFQGDGSSYSPLTAIEIPENVLAETNLLSIYQNTDTLFELADRDVPDLFCRPFSDGKLGLSTYLTAGEISLLAGLPQIEVPGITLKKAVNFGLNEKNIDDDNSITLGKIVQRGRELQVPFKLNKASLSKHTFVAGVTGSGKTTTCHRLLAEFKKPYLVIEPAKTEYRTLINKDKDLVVFTIGNESLAPFRINPFELIEGEIISSHIDMIKATFTSAFPMEGSMPQLLEEAIIKIYEDKGWNLATNNNSVYEERAFDKDVDSFPILSDLLVALESVVKDKKFGDRLGSEYLGSLVSRLSNLTKGSKGYMLDCYHSVDFDFILTNNVVLELEELKSPEDKALIMGFVISRVSSVIKHKHKLDKNYTHLTLIEEAHRLLSKPDYSDSGSKKAAVETFADLLAEVRKYGEGLIIVDQIPNKLASEVLKNTNTKIIHKILARDDKEAVGDTMLMDDKQKEFLSALPTGQTVIFTENTDSPVNVQIDRISDTNEAEIDDSVVEQRFNEKKHIFGYNAYTKKEIMALDKELRNYIRECALMSGNPEALSKLRNSITEISNSYGQNDKDTFSELLKYNLRGMDSADIFGKPLSSIIDDFSDKFASSDDFDDDYLMENTIYFTTISNRYF